MLSFFSEGGGWRAHMYTYFNLALQNDTQEIY